MRIWRYYRCRNGLGAVRRQPGSERLLLDLEFRRPLQCHFPSQLRSGGDVLAIPITYAPATLSIQPGLGLDCGPVWDLAWQNLATPQP
jgi:hypothetical protein